MALPYETMNADQRLAERTVRKLWLDELPKSSDEQSFFKEVTASLVEAKELIEDSLVVDPEAVVAAVDGTSLRSVTARRRAAEIVSKAITKMRVVMMDGVDGAVRMYAPEANYSEMTEEEIKALKAVRRELKLKKKTGY